MDVIEFEQVYDTSGNVYYMMGGYCVYECKDYDNNEIEHNASDIMFNNIRDVLAMLLGEDLIPEIEHDDTCD